MKILFIVLFCLAVVITIEKGSRQRDNRREDREEEELRYKGVTSFFV